MPAQEDNLVKIYTDSRKKLLVFSVTPVKIDQNKK